MVLAKVVKFFEVNIDVQKRALRVREKFDDRYICFIQFILSSVVVIW
jgi:hypothetical protein